MYNWQFTLSPHLKGFYSLMHLLGLLVSTLSFSLGAAVMSGCFTASGWLGPWLRLLVHQLSTNLSFLWASDGQVPRLCSALSFTRLLQISVRFSSLCSCSSVTCHKRSHLQSKISLFLRWVVVPHVC